MSQEHDHDHSEDGGHFCEACGQSFETEEDLEKHQNSFHMDFIWKIKDKIKGITG